MSRQWKLIILLLIGFFLFGFGWVQPALAQDEDPPQDTACWRCHETEYQCREQGQWCCFGNPHRYCTDCHGGNETVWDKELAHIGVINNPVTENPGVCQDCHPDDSAVMIAQFAEMAGIDLSATPIPTHTPYPTEAVILATGNIPASLQIQSWEPWRLAALSVVGLLFMFVVLFGYRCWKADCLAKGAG